MKSLHLFGKEIIGLVLDDEFLAVSVLILVGTVIILLKALSLVPIAGGLLLLIGCVAILLVSVSRAAAER